MSTKKDRGRYVSGGCVCCKKKSAVHACGCALIQRPSIDAYRSRRRQTLSKYHLYLEKKQQKEEKQATVERRKIEKAERKEQGAAEAQEKRRAREQKKTERAEKKKREEEDKAERKRLRDERRELKESQRVGMSASEIAALRARQYVCSVYDRHGKVDDEENGIVWFGCDACDRWYHDCCLSVSKAYVT